MDNKFNGLKAKRDDVYKGEILISRHYRISDEIHIDVIKIATKEEKNQSYIVRLALREFIEKYKQLNNK